MRKTIMLAVALLAMPAAAQDTLEPGACTAPEGWDDVKARNPDFVVFGELHGTAEAPALIARLLCAEAMLGHRVLLAVEHAAYYNAGWQDAWALSPEAFRATLPDLGWRGQEDGVASEAMLAMVLDAHALQNKGAVIDIVAFNGARDPAQKARFADLPSQGPHEASQAENIADAAAGKDYDRVIVLVGGLHAATAPLSSGGPPFEPMAMRLRGYGKVLSLAMQHAGGKSWNCQLTQGTKPAPGQAVTDDMLACAAFPSSAEGASDRPPHIAVGEFVEPNLARRFDGTFWVGPISASPPAFPPEK